MDTTTKKMNFVMATKVVQPNVHLPHCLPRSNAFAYWFILIDMHISLLHINHAFITCWFATIQHVISIMLPCYHAICYPYLLLCIMTCYRLHTIDLHTTIYSLFTLCDYYLSVNFNYNN